MLTNCRPDARYFGKTYRHHEPFPITVVMGDPSLYDVFKKEGKFGEEDFAAINAIKEALGELKSFSFRFLDHHETLIQTLLEERPLFVLNLCDEGYQNQARMELHVPALLEMLQIPYTGSNPANLAVCYNKAIVRAIASEMDLPVPLQFYMHSAKETVTLPSSFPLLLKPCCGDGSIGITKHAVVHTREELNSYIDFLSKELPDSPILIQEFLSGAEFSVGVMGNPGDFELLPILEVDYSALPAELPSILGYETKWLSDSLHWQCIRYKQAQCDKATHQKLIEYSTKLFERLDCHDCARFDFRADSTGQIKLLEVNPNPGLGRDGKMNLMAGFKGLKYTDVWDMLLRAGLKRYQIQVPLMKEASYVDRSKTGNVLSR